MDNIRKNDKYRESGVDVDAGNAFIEKIKPHVKKTMTPGVLNTLGGFAGLFELPIHKYKNPVLVSATDGVGTKLKLAIELQQHDTIGIDLVAMCVNDLIVTGAKPLFFLDYFATGKLRLEQAETIIKGICKGCEIAQCSLIGGETAEMPGVYANEDYDLAGFSVGVVEKDHILESNNVQEGDVLLGLSSSGIHSNGYSLVRRIIEDNKIDLGVPFETKTLGATLLEPTRIYVRSLKALLSEVRISAAVHITGGGMTENIPRSLPSSLGANIDYPSHRWPQVFSWIKKTGDISEEEMYRTFNCGIGFVICLPESQVSHAQKVLHANGETTHILGKVYKTKSEQRIQYLK